MSRIFGHGLFWQKDTSKPSTSGGETKPSPSSSSRPRPPQSSSSSKTNGTSSSSNNVRQRTSETTEKGSEKSRSNGQSSKEKYGGKSSTGASACQANGSASSLSLKVDGRNNLKRRSRSPTSIKVRLSTLALAFVRFPLHSPTRKT